MTETIKGKWSMNDTEKLAELYQAGKTIDEICAVLKRDRKSVINKVYHFGLHRTVQSAT